MGIKEIHRNYAKMNMLIISKYQKNRTNKQTA